MKDNDIINDGGHHVNASGHTINSAGQRVDANGVVIIDDSAHLTDGDRALTEEELVARQNMAANPEYFEDGNKQRIIDDNARRNAGNINPDETYVDAKGNVIDPNDRVITSDNIEIADNQRVIDDNARRNAGNINPNETYVDSKGNVIDATDPAFRNDRDDIDRSEVKHMSKETKSDLNADMITGEPGSHPIGTGIGGVGGAAAGAAIGSIAGPLGTLIGGAIGAIAGGGAGHASAEAINPTHEEAYWRAEHSNASYYKDGHDFDRDMHPAYAVGYANRAKYPADARFEDHENDLRASWEEVKGESRMEWVDARQASHDAWTRASR